ncbi:MAG: hypothetical protein DRI61_05370 [Chloroflexi bacterium]|nr:MAG: hypothetical protein DRI61_05370 [Chloroflexota bacterium]
MKKNPTILTFTALLLIFSALTFSAHAENEVKVGVYYYPWYTGNWEQDHPNCIDTPVLGHYNSQDVTVIRKHLEWLQDLDVDFLIVSWWGPNSFTDNTTKTLFSTANAEETSIEITIMIEPFNSSSGIYNFTLLYDYIYSTYVSQYDNLYMKLYGRPLICFYNDNVNMTKNGKIPLDDRFEVRIIGHEPYANWLYSRNYQMTSWENELAMDGQISVMPRYDDTHFRSPGAQKDPTYSQGYYDQQWNKALNLARQGKVHYVTIATWNEFAERTQIEPCIDKTSYKKNEPYFIYEKTKQYIARIKSPTPQVPTEMVAVFGTLAIALTATLKILKTATTT